MVGTRWKILFFALLALNIIIIGFLCYSLYKPVQNQGLVESNKIKEPIQFQVKTTKENLSQLINQYIDHEGLTKKVHYQVKIGNTVDLYGTLPILNRDIDMKAAFKPLAQKNGDIILQQESVSVGGINFPVTYVMNLISKIYKMPDWVTIDSEKQWIYVSLQHMKLKSGMKVKVEKFNLEQNDISFKLLVPPLTLKKLEDGESK